MSPEPSDPATGSRAEQPGPEQVWARATMGFTRWLDGDQDGLQDLVGVMTPVLWHVVRAYRLSPEAAEDVIQTTWLALVRRRDTIADVVAIGGWLTTTARREAWRSAQKATRDVPTEEQEYQGLLPRQRSAEQAAVEHAERDRLWEAVGTLDERCQRLLRIVAFEHRPDYKQVAATLDMPIGSVGPTRGRCLAKLRVALGSDPVEEGTSR